MKKLFLLAFLVLGAGMAQAQQVIVKSPEVASPSVLNQNEAAVPTLKMQFLPIDENTTIHRDKSVGRITKVSTHQGLTEVGLMANTYGMIGDSRNQIAYDKQSNSIAVVFRGNDRSTNGDGNTLYVRYSNDGGQNWGPQGDNVATSPSPRYPNIFIHNSGSKASTALMWPQIDRFDDGTQSWRDFYTMKSDIGNGNAQYGLSPSPPYWSIPYLTVPDQSTGDLYNMALGLEPSNGASTGEVYLLRSADGGLNWTPVTFDNPVYTADVVPAGYFASNVRLDISPDGSTMIMAFALIIESEPGRAFLVDPNHGVAWRISKDKGMTWGTLQTFVPNDMPNKPGPFANKFNQTWDFDVILDYQNVPHFLVIGSADLNPYSPFDDQPTDSTISLTSVDSTFATEITYDGDPSVTSNWKMIPIGPARRVRTDRMSFTAGNTDFTPTIFRNEPKWARSYDGKKIYAKWISPILSWRIAPVAGVNTLFADTISQIYANGRHIDSKGASPYVFPYDFSTPSNVTNEMDSTMRMTALEEVMAKYTKMAYYAGDDGSLHMIFVEWGIGETLDDDPVNTDQTIWYVQDAKVPVGTASVEQLDATPGDFSLSQNYPNPFNPSTEITFTLPQAGQTVLRVYNILGKEVASLVNEFVTAGTHRVNFDASVLPSGVYIYRLESGSFSTARKMMLSK
ncbi:MAG: T9SS type A sorting domain-containing protein [Bacteroidota bacterium]